MGWSRKLRKPRFVVVYPLAVWLLATAKTTPHTLRLGALLAVLGAGLRLWANGYVGHAKVNRTSAAGSPKIGHLITAGPYAFIRHPLYFGTLLIGAGFLVICGNPWVALLAPVMFVKIYHHKMAEEEATLAAEWPEEFRRYQRAVPRWLPTWKRFAPRFGVWRWRGIVASREPKTFSWVAVALIALFFRHRIVEQGLPLLGEKHVVEHSLLLALMVALMLTDGIAELIRRRARRAAGDALCP